MTPTETTEEMLTAGRRAWWNAVASPNPEMAMRAAWDAILAASPAPSGQGVSGGWQSIDSAPRDGSWFIADGGGLDRPTPMKWCERVGAWEADAVMLEDWDNQAEGYSRPLFWFAIPDRDAAPAPSCAPGEVERLRAELARLHEAARGCEFDLTPTDGPIAQLTLFVHENGDAILAALSPQGLDAKEGGPKLDEHDAYRIRKVAEADCGCRIPAPFDEVADHLAAIAFDEGVKRRRPATPSQRLDAATVERCKKALRDEQDRLDAETNDYLMDTSDCINVLSELLATEPHQHGGKA